ncbi:MAG: hypothetical protein JWL81_1169 [Verrucomicrobiales bacterium]|nr:hypothetical protein [Verrucomicrobiales bacterium]
MKTVLRFCREEWAQLILLLFPMAAALATLPSLSRPVPMQWGLDGRVNWSAPAWGLLILPAALWLIIALVLFFEYRDSSQRLAADGTLTPHGRATRLMRWVVTGVIGGIGLLQIAVATGHSPDVAKAVGALVTVVVIAAGFVFRSLKPNRYVGIRVGWTMNNEKVWSVTHDFAGRLYMISGLAMLAGIFFLPVRWQPALWVTWILLLIVPPLVVAGRAARKVA